MFPSRSSSAPIVDKRYFPQADSWGVILAFRLEKMLVEAGAASVGDVRKIRSGGELGLFVRSIVGLDRQTAKRAFDEFLTGKVLTANQIQFVNLVIDYLTQGGWMSPAQLYESPFTDFSPRGVEGVFDSAQVGQLLSVLDEVRQTAVA